MTSISIRCAAALLFIALLLIPAEGKAEKAENTGKTESPQLLFIESPRSVVHYEAPLERDARAVSEAYDLIVHSVLQQLPFAPVPQRINIVLIKNRDQFRQLSGSTDIAAFVVSERNLMVLDYSRILTKPFTLASTLRHETVHVVLGSAIARERLPRWLNEGVAQWMSDGAAEILLSKDDLLLSRAALNDTWIPLSRLVDAFPQGGNEMKLAYEQSRSLMDYIASQHGKTAIPDILSRLAAGRSIEEATFDTLGVSLRELERAWHKDVTSRTSWFSFFIHNFYEVLFVLSGLLIIYGYFRFLWRMKTYRDEEEEQDRKDAALLSTSEQYQPQSDQRERDS